MLDRQNQAQQDQKKDSRIKKGRIKGIV